MFNIANSERRKQELSSERRTIRGSSPAAIVAPAASRLVRSGSGAGSRGKHRATGETPAVAVCRGENGPVPGGSLDTLAQPCQNPLRASLSSSSLSPEQTFQRRARSRFASVPLATSLAELRSPLEKSYRSTIYCSSCIRQADGVLSSHYCGQRWCLTCNRIRTGRAISIYLPVLRSWGSPHLVTLTVRNCKGEALSAVLDRMREVFQSCRRAIVRTHQLPFVGLRKLECTYNHVRDDYHPHFHVIVDGAEQAELLRLLWLRRWKGEAGKEGQDVRPCDEGGLREIFKYFTKLATKIDGVRRMAIPPAALDIIFQAMRRRRVWQSIGFVLPKEAEESIEADELEVTGTVAFRRPAERIYWEWNQGIADWMDRETGEVLSEYQPGEKFRQFVESIQAGPVAVVSDA